MQSLPRGTVERIRSALAGRGGVLACEVVLVCAIAAVAALLTWKLLPGEGPRVDTRPAAAAAARPTPGDAEAVDIASLHLFGQARESPRERAEPVPADAPETRLNLRLQGVFAVGDGSGFAIIAVGNADEAVFTVGDRVAGQARVNGIYSDRVILERDGTLETLRLATEEVETRTTATDAERAASGNRDMQRIVGNARELRSRLMRNPLQLARMVRFQPYLRDGELIGYRIQPRAADADLLAGIGLEPTDVITSINGIELSDPARAQEVLQRMQTTDTITVTWLRDGERRRMTIPIGSPS